MQTGYWIKTVCDSIVDMLDPLEIILFSVKRGSDGREKSFKLCVVVDTADKLEAEKRIYLGVDSDVPFDVLVYTPEEWDELTAQSNSFARRISEEGTYVYGTGPKQN
jgi:predicted nucleotidyltransferase